MVEGSKLGKLGSGFNETSDPYTRHFSSLAEHNHSLLEEGWKGYLGKTHKNTAYLSPNGIAFKHLAFHIGPKNQNLLTSFPMGVGIDHNFGHVFFSTSISDLEYYLEGKISEFINTNSEEMVYFVDLSQVSEARVQKSYQGKVIFQDEIMKTLASIEKGTGTELDLRTSIDNWITKYTHTFNPLRLSRYKKRGDYVLIRSPIGVLQEK